MIADGEDFCVPCGGCRQRLREFIVPGAEIHLCASSGARQTTTLDALLPRSFGPEFLCPWIREAKRTRPRPVAAARLGSSSAPGLGGSPTP